jgi:chaperone required for assembly of F1-ATPase
VSAGWARKRFWTEVTVAPAEGGFCLRLDERPVRTPAKAPFVAPNRAVAEAAAEEWRAQEGELRPEAMPVTRAVNSAIDRVAPQIAEVREIVAAYGGSDLLCYRAGGPAELVRRQSERWDPALAWAEAAYGAQLFLGEGVMHVAQPERALAALAAAVDGYAPLELTALHDLVAISGSLVLGLAVAEGAMDAEEAWRSSRVDEDWQVEQWGEDAEAAEAAANKRADFLEAARLMRLMRKDAA